MSQLTINIFWSAFNFYLACKGWQDYPSLLNIFYDLVMGVSLVVFGVINMTRMLLDHIACDGSGNKEMERKCSAALLRILIVEMIAISLGFLVTYVLHLSDDVSVLLTSAVFSSIFFLLEGAVPIYTGRIGL